MKIILAIFLMTLSIQETDREPTISKTATIHLNGTVKNVFPLFGPIREKDWAHGWNPVIISGKGEVEEHMVFKTPGRYTDEKEYTWAVTKYDPERFLVEYTVTSKERIWFISVQCNDTGDKTNATITYTFTGFTDMARTRNHESLGRMFAENLADWERAINHYLGTGKQLTE